MFQFEFVKLDILFGMSFEDWEREMGERIELGA
jgi:hypothetical protein